MRPAIVLPLTAMVLLSGISLSAQPQGNAAEQTGASGRETARDSITRALRLLQTELSINASIPADSFRTGNLTIAAGRIESGLIGVYAGTLTIRGRVRSAIVVNGDLVIGAGGQVDNDAIAVRGKVVREAGSLLGGSAVSLGGDLSIAPLLPRTRNALEQTTHEVGISLATLAIVIALGIGVLIFAGGHLVGTAEVLAAETGKSFFFGVLAQVAFLPTLVVMIIALALTVIGLLLIPFAIVAFFLATLGICALGLLAAAHVTGLALGGKYARTLPDRRRNLRALLLGIVLIGGVWVLAALVTSIPIVSAVVRGFAVVMTWVAMTAGLGAAVISRAGRRARERVTEKPIDEEPDLSWQTPTPITGVAAARSPVPQTVGSTGEGGGGR